MYTGATTLSGVRGELPGRSARGRSVAYKCQHFDTAESFQGRIPVLVEMVLLNLLVVLDGHCCGCLKDN